MTQTSNFAAFKTTNMFLACLWVSSLALALFTPPSWDVAWRLEIAKRVINGALLYRDIIEVNPPLWFWTAIPSAYIAEHTSLAPYVVLATTIHLMTLPALWLLDRCLEPLVSKPERNWLVAGTLIAVLMVACSELGQREPPVLLASIMWAALAFRRVKGLAAPAWMIIGVTVFSAYGFALKHYYLLVPIFIEIWLAVHLKRRWRPLRAETIIMAILACAYGFSVVTLTPHFIQDMVPLVDLSYGEVRSADVANPLLHPVKILVTLILMASPVLLVASLLKRHPFIQIGVLVLVVHGVIVVLQGKGFWNHYLTVKGYAVLMAAYAAGIAARGEIKFALNPRLVVATLLFGWFALPCYLVMSMRPPPKAVPTANLDATTTILRAIDSQPQTSRVFVVSTNAGLSFYLPWYLNRPHFQRYYALWMIPGLLNTMYDAVRHDAAAAQLNLLRANTVADIQCAAPHLIIGDTTTHGRKLGDTFSAFDVKPMIILLQDQAFKVWLSDNYVQSKEEWGVTMWRAKTQSGPTPSLCPVRPAQ
jgi:hypothetical protein